MGAYLGAAPALFDQKELLAAATGIFGVEARHAAVIGNLAGKPAEGGVYFNGAFEKPHPAAMSSPPSPRSSPAPPAWPQTPPSPR